jgi:hypothetical protein
MIILLRGRGAGTETICNLCLILRTMLSNAYPKYNYMFHDSLAYFKSQGLPTGSFKFKQDSNPPPRIPMY